MSASKGKSQYSMLWIINDCHSCILCAENARISSSVFAGIAVHLLYERKQIKIFAVMILTCQVLYGEKYIFLMQPHLLSWYSLKVRITRGARLLSQHRTEEFLSQLTVTLECPFIKRQHWGIACKLVSSWGPSPALWRRLMSKLG